MIRLPPFWMFSQYMIFTDRRWKKSELSKYEVCKLKKLRYVEIIYLYIYINYIYDYWSVKLLSKCFVQYLHVNMSISQSKAQLIILFHQKCTYVYEWSMHWWFTKIYTAIVLFEQSKCVDSIFTSDKRSLTVYNRVTLMSCKLTWKLSWNVLKST
jgi:hypothetical protein